jgi:hypothetical protein
MPRRQIWAGHAHEAYKDLGEITTFLDNHNEKGHVNSKMNCSTSNSM